MGELDAARELCLRVLFRRFYEDSKDLLEADDSDVVTSHDSRRLIGSLFKEKYATVIYNPHVAV